MYLNGAIGKTVLIQLTEDAYSDAVIDMFFEKGKGFQACEVVATDEIGVWVRGKFKAHFRTENITEERRMGADVVIRWPYLKGVFIPDYQPTDSTDMKSIGFEI